MKKLIMKKYKNNEEVSIIVSRELLKAIVSGVKLRNGVKWSENNFPMAPFLEQW